MVSSLIMQFERYRSFIHRVRKFYPRIQSYFTHTFIYELLVDNNRLINYLCIATLLGKIYFRLANQS